MAADIWTHCFLTSILKYISCMMKMNMILVICEIIYSMMIMIAGFMVEDYQIRKIVCSKNDWSCFHAVWKGVVF